RLTLPSTVTLGPKKTCSSIFTFRIPEETLVGNRSSIVESLTIMIWLGSSFTKASKLDSYCFRPRTVTIIKSWGRAGGNGLFKFSKVTPSGGFPPAQGSSPKPASFLPQATIVDNATIHTTWHTESKTLLIFFFILIFYTLTICGADKITGDKTKSKSPVLQCMYHSIFGTYV